MNKNTLSEPFISYAANLQRRRFLPLPLAASIKGIKYGAMKQRVSRGKYDVVRRNGHVYVRNNRKFTKD